MLVPLGSLRQMKRDRSRVHYREFYNIFLYVTERCQLRCQHCYMGERLSRGLMLPYARAERIITYCRRLGAEHITFLGGEPTLHPDLTRMIDHAIEVIRTEADRFLNDPKWKHELDGPVEVLGTESVTDTSVTIRSLLRTRPGSQWSVGREFRRRTIARLHREAIDVPKVQPKAPVQAVGAQASTEGHPADQGAGAPTA